MYDVRSALMTGEIKEVKNGKQLLSEVWSISSRKENVK